VQAANALLARVDRATRGQLLDQVRQIANGTSAAIEREATDLKSETSLARKIQTLSEHLGLTLREASAAVDDLLRYTLVVNSSRYTDAVHLIEAGLRSAGCAVHEAGAPVWRVRYYGWNITAMTPNGHRFEVQVHTRASLGAAEATHRHYEELRHPATIAGRRAELDAALTGYVRRWVDVPPGIEIR
jgi:hypothetical protein